MNWELRVLTGSKVLRSSKNLRSVRRTERPLPNANLVEQVPVTSFFCANLQELLWQLLPRSGRGRTEKGNPKENTTYPPSLEPLCLMSVLNLEPGVNNARE